MQTAFEDRFNIRPVFTSLAKTTAIAEQVVQIIKEELAP